MSENKAIVLSGQNSTDIQSLVNKLSGSIKDQSYIKTCKLYNSKLRKEAEKEFERTGNLSHVYRWLNDNGEKISRPSVSNYFNHYYQSENDLELVNHYAENLAVWKNDGATKEERLKTQLAMNDKLIFELMAKTSQGGVNEMRKSADVLVKLQKASLDLQKEIDCVEGRMHPVRILFDKFSNLMQISIRNADSPGTKKILLDIIESLQREVEDIEIDG